ncbi:hypothetical protein G7Y89_g14399 [Cudoniella acicularis]|uniref:Uncharacterized protein n=1 Tax=Cudoniella acicularis TaxID=354080 RepID=A0A8H4R384_9HELO|nr:hypothetical protein G7Y89_g14399 [Cudoniella acicularis]
MPILNNAKRARGEENSEDDKPKGRKRRLVKKDPKNGPKTKKMANFKDLPPEIRLMIYDLDGVLQVRSDGSAPPLLYVLYGIKRLYEDVKAEYHRRNATRLCLEGYDDYIGSLTNEEMKQFRTIRIVLDPSYLK